MSKRDFENLAELFKDLRKSFEKPEGVAVGIGVQGQKDDGEILEEFRKASRLQNNSF